MNHYARAIGILTQSSIDSYKIMVKLAQTDPELFCKLANDESQEQQNPLIASVIGVLGNNPVDNYVHAVKHYRELTNCTFKQALDYVKPLKDSLL